MASLKPSEKQLKVVNCPKCGEEVQFRPFKLSSILFFSLIVIFCSAGVVVNLIKGEVGTALLFLPLAVLFILAIFAEALWIPKENKCKHCGSIVNVTRKKGSGGRFELFTTSTDVPSVEQGQVAIQSCKEAVPVHSESTGEASFGSMLIGIGNFALIAGIVLSMLEGRIGIPGLKGAALGYLMIGGIIVAIIGWLLNKPSKPRPQ